jgi:hypothetical protein
MESFDFNNIDYNDVTDFIIENGFVIIDNLFNKSKCDELVGKTINAFQTINPELNHQDSNKWKNNDLPPQTRTGMFQSIISNINPVKEVRENENYKQIFKEIYSRIKTNYNIDDELVCSIDGINFKPNSRGPYAKSDVSKDWAHLDQTKRNEIYKCLQGQVVLSNTSACFVCSPKSHKLHSEILDICNVSEKDSSNWCKIPFNKYNKCKELIEHNDGSWQVPIKAKAGSCILWFSTTVHSARHSEKKESLVENDPYLGYRCVYYITYRPKNEFTTKQLEKIQNNLINNRNMNHWSTRVFPILPNAGYCPKETYNKNIQKIIINPKQVYDLNI